ncbi:MAG: cyclic dehypoxanthinyl futalosine synthase [Acidobacteriota bacterium]
MSALAASHPLDVTAVLDKVFEGARLSPEEGLLLLERAPFLELAQAADAVRAGKHPDNVATYIVDRNINYTNVCVANCAFCAFYRRPGDAEGYVHTLETLLQKIQETVDLGGTGILLQGGHNPELPFSFYEEMLGAMKARFPKIHIHGFSAPEITFFSKLYKMPVAEVIARLKAVGLGSVPGGGAEILSDGVRKRMARGKATVKEWIAVHREAHRQKLRTTATMMFGSIESSQDILIHLQHVRELQDETGGFTAFIPWTFQPGATTPLQDAPATGVDYLRVLALSRIYLDNVDNIQASWVTQGLKVGQVSLHFGANDMGSIMIEENVVASAGCRNSTNEQELRRLIADAGFTPKKRRTLYEPAED